MLVFRHNADVLFTLEVREQLRFAPFHTGFHAFYFKGRTDQNYHPQVVSCRSTRGGPNNATLTIGMYLYQNGFKYFDFGYASAIGYVLTGIIGVVALIQFRLLREKEA